MNLEIIKDKILDFSKSIGNNLIEEIKKYIENQNMTDESKDLFQKQREDILKKYNIYEVKDRGIYKYSLDLEYPEFSQKLYKGQKNGYYVLKNNELIYDDNFNKKINQEINNAKEKILKKQEKLLNEMRKECEEYIVDELGDDEKKVYLTRKSDNISFEDFKISDELYNKIKERNREGVEATLIWNGNEYELKK